MGKQHLDNSPSQKKNVSKPERILSSLAGGALLANGLIGKKSPLKILAGGFLLYRGLTGNCPAYSAAAKLNIRHPKNITIKTSLTVNKPIAEVYAFWRNLENLPLFMKHLESVQVTDRITSIWRAKVPGRLGTVEWKSSLFLDQENERIGWRSDEGADIMNSGTVHFKDGGKFGTEIHAIISYHAPAGILGEGIGRLLNPIFEGMVQEDIKNFKRYIETGEIPTIEGQPSGSN